tara:strand:- start:91 stop:276 length:186 start_codon:yes stop_codon:yes gene_type:complete
VNPGFQNEFEACHSVENDRGRTSDDDLSCLILGIALLPMHHQYFQYGSNQQFSKVIGISEW